MNIYTALQKQIDILLGEAKINKNFKLSISSDDIVSDELSSKFMLVNEYENTHILISAEQAFIWSKLERDSNIKHLIFDYYQIYHRFAYVLVFETLKNWEEKELIIKNSNIYSILARKIERHKKFHKIISTISSILLKTINIQITSKIYTKFVNKLYSYLKVLFNKYVFSILTTIALCGISLFIFDFLNSELTIVAPENIKLFWSYMLILSIFSIFIHETAHGLSLNHYGHKVKKAGFKLFYGIPLFFVDTTNIWHEKKRRRVIVTLAGLTSNLYLAGLTYLASYFTSSVFLDAILINFSIVNISNFLINSIPFIELDGYYILIDLFNKPNLKAKSLLAFRNMIKKQYINWKGIGLIIFSIISVLTTIFLFLFSSYIVIKNYIVLITIIAEYI